MAWLVSALSAAGVEPLCACMAGFRLVQRSPLSGGRYTVAIGGASDGKLQQPDLGIWTIVLERTRTFWQKLLQRQKIMPRDSLIPVVIHLFLRQAGFENIAAEFES